MSQQINTQRRTIQTMLCELFTENPGASNEEVTERVLAEWPNSTYAPHRVQPDRNKFNKAAFKCQLGVAPEVPAFNPERRPHQQSTEPTAQAQLPIAD